MSVATLVAAIQAEAEAEARAIVDRAAGEAAAIVEAARLRSLERAAAARVAADQAARSEAARRINVLRLRDLGARAAVLADAMEAVFGAARGEVAAIADGGDPQRWARGLGRLVGEASALAGPGATAAVRDGDAAAVREAAAALGARMEVVVDPSQPAGLVARSVDGLVEVDATLPVRLARAREQLAGEVAARLGVVEAPETADR